MENLDLNKNQSNIIEILKIFYISNSSKLNWDSDTHKRQKIIYGTSKGVETLAKTGNDIAIRIESSNGTGNFTGNGTAREIKTSTDTSLYTSTISYNITYTSTGEGMFFYKIMPTSFRYFFN
jgi:hypothetical protein